MVPRCVVTPSAVMRYASPQTEILGSRLSARAESGIELPAERASAAGRVPAAIEGKIAPVIHLGAFAPPEKTLGVIHHAKLARKLDLAVQILHVHAAQQNRVAEIHLERRSDVIVERHRGGNLIKSRAAAGREREQTMHNVGRASGNIRYINFFPARRSPRRRRRRRGHVTLARYKNYRALMLARRDVARVGRVSHRRAFSRTDLAHAIEEGVVKLARDVLTYQPIAKGHIFTAKVRVGGQIEPGLASRSDHRKHAG